MLAGSAQQNTDNSLDAASKLPFEDFGDNRYSRQ